MELNFAELDYCETHMGALILRRRKLLSLGGKVVYEVKLGEEFLMSSLFYEAEVALARRGLEDLGDQPLDVAVGGLGLGYTAQAALALPNVRSLLVIEGLPEVIDWHRRGLVPLGEELSRDPRCRMVQGDFFALAQSEQFDPDCQQTLFHAVLLDIDHTPRHHLHPRHRRFYQPAGLCKMASHLHPGGVFAMWSDDPPDTAFISILESVFVAVAAHVVKFANPLTGGVSANTVYVARCQG